MQAFVTSIGDPEQTVNPPRTRGPYRTIVHPAVEPAPSMLTLDLLVAGFAIVGALVISFLR